MDFLRSTRKRVLGCNRVASYPLLVRIFVKTPTNHTMVVTVHRSASIADIKRKIELNTENAWYPFLRQCLKFRGKLLDDDQTLVTCNISNDSTLQLKMLPRGRAPCSIVVKILPGIRDINLKVTHGLNATIRDVKLLLGKQEGIQCEELSLVEDLYGEQLGDDVTLEACHVPDQTLVWIQSPSPSPCSSSPQRNRGMTAAIFGDAFTYRRTMPSSGDTEHLEDEVPEQVSCQGAVSNLDRVTATVQQSHEDSDRKISHTLDESNKLNVDSQLQSEQSLLSLAREDMKRLKQELKELQIEFAQKVSLVIKEKNNVHQQLSEVQNEFQRQISLVLDENSELQKKSCQLEKELDTVRIQLGQEKERSLCMICFDRPRDTLVLSCLHLHFCSPCLEKHQEKNSTCPSCRGFISGKLICRVSVL